MKSIYIKSIIIKLLVINLLFGVNIEKELQTQLILVESGGIIRIPKGTSEIKGTLSIEGKEDITIIGEGMNHSILSFINQEEGAEGLKITNCKNITLKDFSVQNSKGDGIKSQDTDKIYFYNVKTEWTNGPKPTNGSYGIYPVQCSNIIIDGCVAIGASDAGIYVGQSKNIIVKNSEAYHNVAGIEIENSVNADVFDNYAHNNTGGILVFDLPDLEVKSGHAVRIYNNKVEENNLFNFAPPGNIVGTVPPGTGIMVLATSGVEIFKNEIINNKTVGTAIVSYFITEEPILDSLYNPYTSEIYIHDNKFERKKQFPTLKHEIGQLLFFKFWRNVPEIIYDGNPDPQFINENGEVEVGKEFCIANNENADFLNLDINNNFEKWYTPFFTSFSQDKKSFNCELQPIPQTIVEK